MPFILTQNLFLKNLFFRHRISTPFKSLNDGPRMPIFLHCLYLMAIFWAHVLRIARLELALKNVSVFVVRCWAADETIKCLLRLISVLNVAWNNVHVVAVYIFHQNSPIFRSASEFMAHAIILLIETGFVQSVTLYGWASLKGISVFDSRHFGGIQDRIFHAPRFLRFYRIFIFKYTVWRFLLISHILLFILIFDNNRSLAVFAHILILVEAAYSLWVVILCLWAYGSNRLDRRRCIFLYLSLSMLHLSQPRLLSIMSTLAFRWSNRYDFLLLLLGLSRIKGLAHLGCSLSVGVFRYKFFQLCLFDLKLILLRILTLFYNISLSLSFLRVARRSLFLDSLLS